MIKRIYERFRPEVIKINIKIINITIIIWWVRLIGFEEIGDLITCFIWLNKTQCNILCKASRTWHDFLSYHWYSLQPRQWTLEWHLEIYQALINYQFYKNNKKWKNQNLTYAGGGLGGDRVNNSSSSWSKCGSSKDESLVEKVASHPVSELSTIIFISVRGARQPVPSTQYPPFHIGQLHSAWMSPSGSNLDKSSFLKILTC